MQQFAASHSQHNAAPVKWSTLFRLNPLSERVQSHLTRVYATLAAALLAALVGVVVDLRWHVGGTLTAIASIGLLIALASQQSANVSTRLQLLGGYAFVQGLSLGPLIALALHVDPAIVVTALLGTLTVFACFSLSAIYSSRRSYLFLGGILSSALSLLMWMSLLSLFWRPVFMYSVHLYGGLAIFCAYVLYDTQLIIERAELGSGDYVHHALELFVDFLAILVRIIIILLRNASQKEEDDRRKRSSASGASVRR